MSYSKYKPANSSQKAQEKNYLNLIFSSHDFFCYCNTPGKHILHLIKPIAEEEPCHGDTPTTKEDGDPDIDDGDLERLFAEDVDDPTTG